jgi:addiction module RelE/StbE family toxin
VRELDWSYRALRDLANIYDYYHRNVSDEAAARVVDDIRATVELLRKNPRIGRELELRARRELVTGDYVVTYQVKRDRVRLVKIEHGRQRH